MKITAESSFVKRAMSKEYLRELEVNSPAEYEKLTHETQVALDNWIEQTYKFAKTVWRGHTSYGEKHQFEHDTGIYICNGAFKGGMKKAGFLAKDEQELNWEYYVRLKRERDYQRPQSLER